MFLFQLESIRIQTKCSRIEANRSKRIDKLELYNNWAQKVKLICVRLHDIEYERNYISLNSFSVEN